MNNFSIRKYLFCPLRAKFKGICHRDDENLKNAVRKLLRDQQEELYRRGIHDLSQRSTTATTRQKEFFGGYHCLGNIFIFKMMYHNHILICK